MNLTHLKRLIKASARYFVMICVGALLIFSQIQPAFAIEKGSSSTPSSPSKGAEVLDDIYETSKESLRNEPRSRQELEDTANPGINEVQGTADSDKTYRPAESSQRADSIEQNIKEGLEKVTGNR